MDNILIPVLIVVSIGIVAAGILTIASKVFSVHVDETVALIRAELPGANCGACGYAGCDDYANALGADHTLSTSLCPVGGSEVAKKVAAVLGVEAGEAIPKVAIVKCSGDNEATGKIMEYQGIQTCSSAKQFFGGMSACTHGCMGLGDCVTVCQYDAIKICDGVAVVNRQNCVGCGMCAKECPNSVIEMISSKNLVVVQCKSTETGAKTRKACSNGCIACKKCEKICKFDAIHVENNLADIDYAKCTNCGLCVKECPTGAILNMRIKKAAAKKVDVKSLT